MLIDKSLVLTIRTTTIYIFDSLILIFIVCAHKKEWILLSIIFAFETGFVHNFTLQSLLTLCPPVDQCELLFKILRFAASSNPTNTE